MQVRPDSIEIVEIVNGHALYGTTLEGKRVFLAHLGDGADGLPNPLDPELAEAYGFELAPILVECPECAGRGVIFARATAGMWAGIMTWPGDVRGETCSFCDGSGEVTAEQYRWYEAAMAETFDD